MMNENNSKNVLSFGLLGLGSSIFVYYRGISFESVIFFIKFLIPVIIIIFVLGLILLYFYQNKLIYLNYASDQASSNCEDNPQGFRNPKERGIHYEEVIMYTRDNIKLKGWLMLQPNPEDCNTLLYFHGSASNRGFRMDRLSKIFFALGMNILIVDYRGYAGSEGTPSEEGLQRDAEAVFDFALQSPYINPKKILVYGKSLGGAVAIYIAHKMQEKVLAVIIENTFTSFKDAIDFRVPYLRFFKCIIRSYWPSITRILNIKRPILVLYGENDNVADCNFSKTLFERATSSVYREIHGIPDGDHNNCHIFGRYVYFPTIKRFISKINNDFPLQLIFLLFAEVSKCDIDQMSSGSIFSLCEFLNY